MKNILKLIIGFFIVILSNTILNYLFKEPRINYVLVYFIIVTIYSKNRKSDFVFAILLGLMLDSSISIYSYMYTFLFFTIEIIMYYLKDNFIKNNFIVNMNISFILLLVSIIYENMLLFSYKNSFLNLLKLDLIYILKSMIFIFIAIFIVQKFKRERD